MASHSGHSMISGEGIVVTGGSFIQNIISQEPNPSLKILRKNVAHAAFHNSSERFDPPKCHPNTRVAVLKMIMDWVHRSDWETWYRYVLWLTGAAGAGKSAIAQSIIELCLLERLVIASFFFFRSDGTRNHGKSFIATLAYQIFRSLPETQTRIQAAIDDDPFIFTRSLEHQFDKLVIQPLRTFYKPLDTLDEKCRRLIVIDGLDECLNRDTQVQILNMIRDAIRTYELPVIFLIASRPEHDIKTAFGSKSMDGVFARIYLDDNFQPDKDIHTFLQDSFEDIKANHPFRSYIPEDWPHPQTVQTLVKKSSGQFIYAATVILYVKSIRHQPHYRLDIVMNLRPAQGDRPFADLDALYTFILSSAADKERVLYALSIYSHGVVGEYDFCDTAEFMSLEAGELDVLFCDLGSLICIESIQRCKRTIRRIRILHASLQDFLLDAMRSKDYFIDINNYRTEHITNILRYLTLQSASRIMTDKAKAVQPFLRKNFPMCKSSPDLMKQASSFPLRSAMDDNNGFGMKELVFYTILPFFMSMARHDQQWTLIVGRHLEELEKIFMSTISNYYNDAWLTLMLCVVYHIGNHPAIPWLGFSICTGEFFTKTEGRDTLRLHVIIRDTLGTDMDQYRHCLLRFLQNPEKSSQYGIGDEAYTNATLCCLQHLELTGTHAKGNMDEDALCNRISLDNGIWKFDSSKFPSGYCDETMKYFVYLGYVIFFLPLSGKSQQLIHYCRKPTFLTKWATSVFPKRTASVRQAMRDYQERVEGESFQE